MAATIPIFDGENYDVWNVKTKTLFLYLFLSMDLWDTVENGCDDETDKENQKKNDAALSLIQGGVSDWIFKKIMKAKKRVTDLIVATLIATVAFAAGITIPGGYINDNKDPNQGMAILTRKARQLALAFVCTAYAMIAMLLAFITGTYAVLASSSLSILVCVIPSILLVMYLIYSNIFFPLLISEDIQPLSPLLSLPSEQNADLSSDECTKSVSVSIIM
ncbi:hypothetical protein CsSME_00020757 [Camellia sinensis var. sinensis]